MNYFDNALTIAGSDSGGGAGIQADLKTFSSLDVYGTSVITSITAQNHREIKEIFELPLSIIKAQLESVFEGYSIGAVKTGILFSAEIIETVSKFLSEKKKPDGFAIIVDPIMISTSGSSLIDKDAIAVLEKKLFPIASLITPNIGEAEYLTGMKINSIREMKEASKILFNRYNTAILLKGGHLKSEAIDILFTNKGIDEFKSDIIREVNTHGSGCTLSAAICAYICKGNTIENAVGNAKKYITSSILKPKQIADNLKIINHFFKK